MNKSYCYVRGCLREVKYADQKKKNILPVMMEPTSPISSNGIDFVFSSYLY